MDDKVFVDGMLAKPGPDGEEFKWVKAKLSIKLDEFGAWVAAQKKSDPDIEWLNIEIKEGRSGRWYAERNMWKPPADQPARQPARQPTPAPTEDIPW